MTKQKIALVCDWLTGVGGVCGWWAIDYEPPDLLNGFVSRWRNIKNQ